MGLRGSFGTFLAAGLSDYLPILLMGVLAVAFAVASLGASALLRPHRPNRPKLSAYESGNDPVRLPGGERFSVSLERGFDCFRDRHSERAEIRQATRIT